jgi:hypothetical protein
MGLGLLCSAATAQTPQVFSGSTAVGQSSATLTVTVPITVSGTAVAPKALTQGVVNGEFTINGGSCAAGSYMATQQCTVVVGFSPKFPGLRTGAVVVETSDGTLLGSVLLAGLATGPLPLLTPGTINTVAGVFGSIRFAGDGIQATTAPIQLPAGVVADAAGDFYLSDTQNFRIRKVTAAGDISTIAGTGQAGYGGDGGPATQALIDAPAGLALDGAGNLYFADTNNNIIRRIDAFSGVITTVAGTPLNNGFSGDGGAATSALLTSPEGIAFDEAGDLFIADTGNNVIRKVTAAGTISTVAGTGTAGFNGDGPTATAAQLNSPWGVSVAVAQDGSLYIADLGNNRVRKVTTAGVISTIAGDGTRAFTGDGGPASAAELNQPTAIAIDPAGNLYIADSENNRVREISASTGNTIETICGTGVVASTQPGLGDDGSAIAATINEPYALYFDQSGNLFIADRLDSLIRQINGLAISLQYATIKVGNISPAQVVDLANDGNADLLLTAPSLVMAAIGSSPTPTCTTDADIPSAGLCSIGAEFAPTVISDPVTDPVLGSITVNSQNSTPATSPVINLSGIVLNVTPTNVALTSSLNPSLLGQSVTFTATVTSNGTALTGLTGTVTFLNGNSATPLCSVAISGNGSATCSTSTLPLGTSNITAMYSGDSNDEANNSNVLAQVVEQMPILSLVVTPNPAVVTTNVTLTFTAAPPTGSTTGTPTGTVTFMDGMTALNTTPLPLSSGVATFTTATLGLGVHSLSAKYTGVAPNASGTSNVVQETIQQATTSTTLSSTAPTAAVGVQVTFTAVVASTDNGPVPAGTVTFNSGTTPLGTITIGSNGTAVLPISSLAPGTYSITAVYSGDTDDAPSTSTPPLTETIQKIPTATTLSPSLNPIFAGAVLTLSSAVSATGSATGAGALTGEVTFSEGATVYGSVAINGSGDATLPISTLSAGSHSIIATYSGNTNYATSTSTVLVEVVQPTATMTTLTSTAATTLAGEPASFSASVSSTTGIPTGSVSFFDGGASIGQAQLNAQGVATLSTSTLTVGTHTITATYAGNGNYNTSTSAALPHTVILATASLTLAGPGTPVDAGGTFAMTAALSNNGVAPTGTLTLHNGAATIATLGVTADGTFSFSNLSLGVGTYQLTAVYSGDTHNAAATSAAVTVVVQLTPTTTSLSSSVNPVTLGQSVTFTATASGGTPHPTGTIEFLDGTTVLGSSTVNANGTATFAISTLTFGAQSITATYEGDTDHAVSASAALSEKVVQAATASLSSSVNPSIFGVNVAFTVKITGVGSLIPTGMVTFSDGATTLGTATLSNTGTASLQTAALAVGSHSISVSYSGDTNYSTTSTVLIQTVQSATTQISLAASANPAIYGTPLTLTATVTGNGGLVGTGSVTFTDGGTSIGSALLNANGVASLSLSTLAPGAHSIVANYAGDSNINASSSTPLIVVVKELTAVALASSANPTSTLSSIVLTATVTNSGVGVATGTVTFTDGSTQLGTVTLNASGVATLALPSLSAGNHALQASYAGDAQNFSSMSPVLTEGIQLRPTTTAITSSATDPNNPLQITLIAAVGWTGPVAPTGTVTFTSGTTVLGSSQLDSIGIATLSVILPTSTESIVATYSGDVSYATSSSLAATISGGIATQFTMQLNPSSLTLQSTQHAPTNVTLTSLQGFSDTLQLGCLGLPFAATCTFSTPQVKLAANGVATVQLIVDTGDPLGAGSTAKLERRQTSGILLCLLPCLLGIGLGARRKKFKASTLLLLVCMVAMTLSAVGCSGLKVNGTPAGTYTFKVTASGTGSGATVSQTMTLTVTQ